MDHVEHTMGDSNNNPKDHGTLRAMLDKQEQAIQQIQLLLDETRQRHHAIKRAVLSWSPSSPSEREGGRGSHGGIAQFQTATSSSGIAPRTQTVSVASTASTSRSLTTTTSMMLAVAKAGSPERSTTRNRSDAKRNRATEETQNTNGNGREKVARQNVLQDFPPSATTSSQKNQEDTLSAVEQTLQRLPATLEGLKSSQIPSGEDNEEIRECFQDELARSYLFLYLNKAGGDENSVRTEIHQLKQWTVDLARKLTEPLQEEFSRVMRSKSSVHTAATAIRDLIIENMPEDSELQSVVSNVIGLCLSQWVVTNEYSPKTYAAIARAIISTEDEFMEKVGKVYVQSLSITAVLFTLPKNEAFVVARRAGNGALVKALDAISSLNGHKKCFDAVARAFERGSPALRRTITELFLKNLPKKMLEESGFCGCPQGVGTGTPEETIEGILKGDKKAEMTLSIASNFADKGVKERVKKIEEIIHSIIDKLCSMEAPNSTSCELNEALVHALVTHLPPIDVYYNIVKGKLWHHFQKLCNEASLSTLGTEERQQFRLCTSMMKATLSSLLQASRQPREIAIALKAMVNVCSILHDMLRRNTSVSDRQNTGTMFHMDFSMQLACADCIISCWASIKTHLSAVSLIVTSMGYQPAAGKLEKPVSWHPKDPDVKLVGSSYKGIRYAVWSVVDWRRQLDREKILDLPRHLLLASPTPEKDELQERSKEVTL
eukprot:gb/GECG01015625.1/.p1 GENE.gb/GECG01015625.1/~~gb/GECG01015625.1/.p1  ORF type:complete len:718 (+),score=94.26 gb/GECG01015625.1/:1-2154(+)